MCSVGGMRKRADGELEIEILKVLWDANEPLATSDVQERLHSDLAYTSVATVLSRLVDKRLVLRRPKGRSYVYESAISHDEWYANRMLAVLRETSNHRTLLAGFVGKLSSRDRQALRSLLEDGKGKL